MESPSAPKSSQQPRDRTDFRIAIVCALRDESSAVRAVFDETWDSSWYGKAQNDTNTYTPGRIGRHNVVLAYLPGMGGTATAALTAHFRHSYPSISLILVVGICGGAPFGENKQPIGLGDIIISDSTVQYTYVRRYPHCSRRKDTLADSLSRPNQEIRGFLHMLETIPERKVLRQRMFQSLELMLEDEDYTEWKRPGEQTNKLFYKSYRHKHQKRGECETCDRCIEDRDEVCELALSTTCLELGCDNLQSEARSGTAPVVHFGKIASGDQVMKSAIDRDIIVKEEQAIAFEMEGAGAWDNIPTVIIKSVCDFADSHKNDDWQKYASCVAACCMKALITAWTATDAGGSLNAQPSSPSSAHDERPLPQLIIAASLDNFENFSRIYKANPDIHVRDPQQGRTPLHMAAAFGRQQILETLISAGAEIDAKTFDGTTPLTGACIHGHLTLVSSLLDAGANVNAVMNSGYSVLFAAVVNKRSRIVRLLIQRGANATLKVEGWTVLDVALRKGDRDTVEALQGKDWLHK